MRLTIQDWEAARRAAHAAARAEARQRAANRGLPAADADTLARACPVPLVAYLDGHAATFVADDAARLMQLFDTPAARELDGRPVVRVDRRELNTALAALEAAGLAVVVQDLPA